MHVCSLDSMPFRCGAIHVSRFLLKLSTEQNSCISFAAERRELRMYDGQFCGKGPLMSFFEEFQEG